MNMCSYGCLYNSTTYNSHVWILNALTIVRRNVFNMPIDYSKVRYLEISYYYITKLKVISLDIFQYKTSCLRYYWLLH